MALPPLRNPFVAFVRYWQRLTATVGWRFLVLLFSAYGGVKGVVNVLTYAAFTFFMRNAVGVTNAAQVQSFFTVSRLPWSLKPLIGGLSDMLPLMGYHKRPYLLGSAVAGTAAAISLAAAPLRGLEGGGTIAAALLFVLTLETATVDLLVEGAYTRLMVSLPETGGDIVSAVWAFVMFGALGASGLVATVASRDAALVWWVATPFAAQVVLPVAAGWLSEARSTGGFRGRDLVGAHREVFGVSALIAVGALGLAAASLWGNTIVQTAVSISSSVVVCGVSLWLLPPVIAKAQVYMFLTSAMNLQLRGAIDVFYTGSAECVPGGPAFSISFYYAWSAMIGSIAGIVGVVAFQAFLSRTWFRRAFWTTTVLQVVAASVDIVLVLRWNRRLGISDRLFFILGNSMLQETVFMLDWMPAVVLISKLCPPGVESTVYALLSGFANYGHAVASSLGSLAIDVARIKTPRQGRCDFDNLPLLVVIGHVVLPLLTIPLTWVLIPDARMTDDVLGATPMRRAKEGDRNEESADEEDEERGSGGEDWTGSSEDGGAVEEGAGVGCGAVVDDWRAVFLRDLLSAKLIAVGVPPASLLITGSARVSTERVAPPAFPPSSGSAAGAAVAAAALALLLSLPLPPSALANIPAGYRLPPAPPTTNAQVILLDAVPLPTRTAAAVAAVSRPLGSVTTASSGNIRSSGGEVQAAGGLKPPDAIAVAARSAGAALPAAEAALTAAVGKDPDAPAAARVRAALDTVRSGVRSMEAAAAAGRGPRLRPAVLAAQESALSALDVAATSAAEALGGGPGGVIADRVAAAAEEAPGVTPFGRRALVGVSVASRGRMVIEVDGLNAPASAGAFLSRVRSGDFSGARLGVDEVAVVAGLKGGTAVPLEVALVGGDGEVVYGETLEESGRYTEKPVLNFNPYGAVALARPPTDTNGANGGIFLVKSDPSVTPAGLNLLDGAFSVVGYVVGAEGRAVMAELVTGDVIDHADVLDEY